MVRRRRQNDGKAKDGRPYSFRAEVLVSWISAVAYQEAFAESLHAPRNFDVNSNELVFYSLDNFW